MARAETADEGALRVSAEKESMDQLGPGWRDPGRGHLGEMFPNISSVCREQK